VSRDLLFAPKVVQSPLNAATDAADGLAAIEEWHRLVVLALAILDNERAPFVVGVNRQLATPTIAARVADQPVEPMLAASTLCEQLIAEVNDVRLVAVAPHAGERTPRPVRAASELRPATLVR